MPAQKDFHSKISDLIARAKDIVRGEGEDVITDAMTDFRRKQFFNLDKAKAYGWVASAKTIIESLVPHEQHPYRRMAGTIAIGGPSGSFRAEVATLREILRSLDGDLRGGFLQSIEDEVRSVTFDDLLDHADHYLDEGRKDPAGVLAAAVFEDAMRKAAAKRQLGGSEKQLEQVIHVLRSAGVLSRLDTKHAASHQALRNAALHANWSEFTPDHVRLCIDFTRKFLANEAGR